MIHNNNLVAKLFSDGREAADYFENGYGKNKTEGHGQSSVRHHIAD